MEHYKDLAILFQKYLSNQCTKEEARDLFELMRSTEHREAIQSLLDQSLDHDAADYIQYKTRTEHIFKNLELSINDCEGQEEQVQKKFPIIKVAAAIAVSLLCYAAYYFLRPSVKNQAENVVVAKDVSPGGNNAMLILSDGQQIELNKLQVGNITEDGGSIIKKAADGQLAYLSTAHNKKFNGLNTVKTPKGGQYQVVLPDGSKVWLNAASSITYPSAFSDSERHVSLKGEGYFEITTILKNDKKVPFVVETAKQKIEVLGTRFNVNAYDDEKGIKTTLIEGKVKVVTENETVILKPNQEFSLAPEGISTKKVDTDPVIDWKNGDFIFAEEDIKSIMRKIGRWYNVDLAYETEIPDENLSGQISRNKNLSEVLRMLELSGNIKFNIQNDTIYISKRK